MHIMGLDEVKALCGGCMVTGSGTASVSAACQPVSGVTITDYVTACSEESDQFANRKE